MPIDNGLKSITLSEFTPRDVVGALQTIHHNIKNDLQDIDGTYDDIIIYKFNVGGEVINEADFYEMIAEKSLPVVPELRALLLAYTSALGKGVHPWQDPDEGVGGLGPALHTLGPLDPDCFDVLRAYLETRDGEHEGYTLDVVVPAFFKRHGWRDAEAVRFGIYATLNRYWGGRKPPQDFDGMRTAMARLLAPEEVVEAVRREAEHFERKPCFGYDSAAYRAAFRTLLDPALPFEATVLAGLAESPPA